MIFQDGNALQKQLYNDLDSLIKIIKCEQQDYLEVNDVLANIFLNKQELETNLFICNQIATYRQLVKNIQVKQESYSSEKKSIVQKYDNVQSVEQSVTGLLKRVVYRVLEVVFSSINQLSLKPVNSYQQYIRFKLICQKLLVEVNPEKPLKILKFINDYTTNKLNKSLLALSIVANNLENGKIQEIDKLKLSSALNKIQQKDIYIKHNKSNILQNSNKLTCKIKENNPLTKQKLKESAKVNEKGRFLHQIKAKMIMDSIKDVMQINRQEFLQEFVQFCQEDNKNKLLKGLMAKNRHNQRQISEFLAKKIHYKRKISSQLVLKAAKHQTKDQSTKMQALKDEFSRPSCHTTRKSLLLKSKDNEFQQRTITSQLYRKINKVQQYRSKLRRSQINSNIEIKKQQENKIGIYKAIEGIISQNQELNLKIQGYNTNNKKQRLPVLNKRAVSVDQNYKTEELQVMVIDNQSKILNASTKFADSLKKKCKGEKTQMFPSKIKIELKTANNLICNEINKKLSKYDHFNRNLCF